MLDMKNKIYTKCQSFKRLVGQFKTAQEGIAAIEFALIAPLMILVYFAVTEISIAVTKTRNVAHTASVVGDLAAQLTSINSDQMDDIMTAGVAVMDLSNDDVANQRLTIEIQSWGPDEDGDVTALGVARLGPSISTFNAGTIHERLLNEDSGVIVARVVFRHSPITAEYIEMMDIEETFILKPRQSATIPFDEGGSALLVSCGINGNFIVTGC